MKKEKRVGVVAQKNTHHASKYFLVYKKSNTKILKLHINMVFESVILTDKYLTSKDLVFINQLVKRSSQPYIFRVRIYVSSSPVLLTLLECLIKKYNSCQSNIQNMLKLWKKKVHTPFILLLHHVFGSTGNQLSNPFIYCIRTLLGSIMLQTYHKTYGYEFKETLPGINKIVIVIPATKANWTCV